MTKSEQWGANKKFLNRAIDRGDKIVLSNKVTNIAKETGAFKMELNYLKKKGYKLAKSGKEMKKRKYTTWK
jgi:hypothetical protein